MTRLEFYDECTRRSVSPFLALENDAIRSALKDRDDEKVRKLLDKEF